MNIPGSTKERASDNERNYRLYEVAAAIQLLAERQAADSAAVPPAQPHVLRIVETGEAQQAATGENQVFESEARRLVDEARDAA